MGSNDAVQCGTFLDRLFGNLSRSRFVDEYLHKLPYACAANTGSAQVCGEALAVELLGNPKSDVLVVRRGNQRFHRPPLAEQDCRSLIADGWTIVVRQAQRADPTLERIAREFANAFNGAVDIHLYWTPAGQFGFGWHYDVEDVFVVQGQGIKNYSLRKNTVNPWPTAESFPQNLRYEREIMPLMRCTLAPGDWLYLPAGYWHKAEAATESLSLAIGLTSPTRLDALTFLRHKLAQDLQWRERLPVVGNATGASDELLHLGYGKLVDEIAEGMRRVLAQPDIAADFIGWLRQQGGSAADQC